MSLTDRDFLVSNLLDRIDALEDRVRDLQEHAFLPAAAGLAPEQPNWAELSGWVVTGTVLRDVDGLIVLDPSVPKIEIAAGGYIESADFVSGTSGFQINGGTAEFNDVVVRGTIYATAGEIGGWTIESAYIALDTGTDAESAGMAPGDYPFYAGATYANRATAPFRVTPAGALVASSANITGTIDANAGHLGSLDVDGVITVGAAAPYIQIDGPNKRIRSSNYAAGVAGMTIAANGDAEFANVRIRGALTTAVFVKDLIEARAGSMLITKSGGALYADMVVPGAGTWSMTIEDPPGGGFLFANSDICRCRTEYASGIGDIWFTVSARTDNGNGTQSYTCTFASGTRSITYPAGAPVVDYGVSGDGGLLLTADDGIGDAPFLSIFTHAGSPWSATTEQVRLGNLNGLADYVADAYGIFVGDYAGDKWLAYDPTNSLRVRGDALVEGTVTADKFNVGDSGLFSGANGKLLLGPGCPLTATSWTSLRGQAATIANAFQAARGVFPGTRGLVMEAGCTNIVANPSAGVNVTDWWTSCIGGTVARDTTVYKFDGACFKITSDATAGGPYLYKGTAVTNPAQDAVYYFSAWVRGSADTVGQNVRIACTESGGATATETIYADFTLTGGWTKVWVKHTVIRADRTALNCYVRFTQCTTNGHYGYVDGFQLESGRMTSTCIGSMPWCAWSGTAHNSTSTRTGTVMTVPTAGNISATLGSIAIRFRVNDTWNASGGMLFCAGDANGEFDAYVNSTGSIQYRFQGSVQAATAVGSVTANVDHLAVFTWDSASDDADIYFDGVLAADGDCGGGAPTLYTQLGIGYSPIIGINYNLGGIITEFAVFGDILTAAEVAALWQLRAPLIDHGAGDTPGIYITDGKFQIMSAYTGTRIEITSAEIAGYNGATKQFYLQASDGKAYAGAGAVVLDANGIDIITQDSTTATRAYKLSEAGGTDYGYLWGYYDDDTDVHHTIIGSYSTGTWNSYVWLIAEAVAGEYMEANLVCVNTAVTRYCGVYANIETDGTERIYIFTTEPGEVYGDLRGTASAGLGVTWQADNELTYTTSVRASKMDIRDVEVDRQRFMALRPVVYQAIDAPGRDVVGLIAEDVETVYPELACYMQEGKGHPRDRKKDAPLKLAGYDAQQVGMLSLAMVQAHERDLDELRQRVAALEDV